MGGWNESKLDVKICLNADTCDVAQDAEPVPRLGLDAPIQGGVKSRGVVGHETGMGNLSLCHKTNGAKGAVEFSGLERDDPRGSTSDRRRVRGTDHRNSEGRGVRGGIKEQKRHAHRRGKFAPAPACYREK